MESEVLVYITFRALAFVREKTRGAASVLNGFKNEPLYEFIGEVILKINGSEKFIKNSERVFTYKDH